jgi:glycerol 2-dehydrogenase (NADP+)/D-galacturonate reductase
LGRHFYEVADVTRKLTFCVLQVARGTTVLAKSVTESRIKANLEIVDLDTEDVKILDDYSNSLAKEGKLERYVYPPFGINFGFPDKQEGRAMPKGI